MKSWWRYRASVCGIILLTSVGCFSSLAIAQTTEIIISDLIDAIPDDDSFEVVDPLSQRVDRSDEIGSSPTPVPTVSRPTIEPATTPLPLPMPVSGPAVGPNAENVIVVCPPALLPELATWIDYRQQQGFRVMQIDGRLTAVEILTTIRKFSRGHSVRCIVLVGDADLLMHQDANLRSVCVPTFLANSEINAELGAESHIATDNPYGDLNGDQIPDIPVGRISVDSAHQLRVITQKIIDYENLPRGGEWRRSIQLAAGVGDFGVVADTLIETAAKKLISEGIPAAYRTTVTYGNWRSPFCPDPRLFREHMLHQVEQGCLFWVYMGHGRAHRLDRFQVSNLLIPVLEAGDVPRFRSANGLPIAVLLACYAGAFDQPRDCLAEQLLRTKQGPIAVLASSRVTMPYSMSILGTSLMESAFSSKASSRGADRAVRLGDIVLQGKRGLSSEHTGGKNRKLMDSIARTLSPTKEKLSEERQEHQLLFNLLGDPLLRIEQPLLIDISAPERTVAGNRILLQGQSPISGRCTLELVCRRDRLTFDFPRRRNLSGGNEMLMEMNHTYHQANDSRWHHRQMKLRKGKFAIELEIPAKARGHAHARLIVQGNDDFALGATDIYIRSADAESGLRTSNAER